MIPILNLRAYTAWDPLDGLSNVKRTILHMIVCSCITVSMIILIDSVFHIVFFKSLCWQIAEVFMFGVLYALIIINTRKSSSIFHFLIILVPLYIGDLYLETHYMRSFDERAIWNYYHGSFIYNFEQVPLRFLITLSFDGLLMGPLCLWISRMIASFMVSRTGTHYDENYHRLFNEERTKDIPIALPKRVQLWQSGGTKNFLSKIDFDFWILRILGIFFLIYLGILLVGSVGTVSMASADLIWPEQLAKLITDTYANAFHQTHTIGKISNFILLAMTAAFHTGIRYLALRIFMLGNLVAAICSFYLYYFSSGEEFLFQSGIADSLVTLLSFILYLRSKKDFDKKFVEQKYKSKDATIAERLLMYSYLFVSIVFVVLMILLVGGFLLGAFQEGFFEKWFALIRLPEAMLLNSITFAFTSAMLAYYCYRYKAARSILTHNLTDPILYSTIAAGIWSVFFYVNSLEDPAYLKIYLLIFSLLGIKMIWLIRKARSLYYNMDFQITCLHPSEADTAQAAVTTIYGLDNVNALSAVRKIDNFIANIKGRKRGLINFPFFILENILCSLMALRPRFSSMGLDERAYFLQKYILRKPADVGKAFIPAFANVANKIGISIKAITSLSFLSTTEGRAFVEYIEPERRDRYATDTQFSPAPFDIVPKLPENETDPLNFRPTETIPQKTLQAKRISTSAGENNFKDNYDYIIIGSGAAGAVMAYRLASDEKIDPQRILVVERGSRLSRHTEMNDDEMEMLASLYKEGGLQQTKKFDMVVLQGETLGGTTVINNAVCLQIPDEMKLSWQKDYGLSLENIQLHYDKIRAEINIHPIDTNAINQKVRAKFMDGVHAFNAKNENVLSMIDPLEVNARFEDGDGLWNLGNKRGKKLSMDETYIPWAERKGVDILTNANALKFITGSEDGSNLGNRSAKSVLIQLQDGTVEIKINKKLVICGGCIASTHFIMRSTEDRFKNDAVGKNLACNYAFPFAFEFEDELKAYDGTQITLGALHKTKQYVFETYFNPPAAFAITLPFNFETHRDVLKHYKYYLNFGILLGSSNVGRIDKKYDPITGRAFEFDLSSSDDLKRIKAAMRNMIELGKCAGAKSVIIPFNPGMRIEFSDEASYHKFLNDFDDYELRQADLILSTAHPQGGNSMIGKSSLQGVVGTDFRLNGFENVYVADASIFPSSIGVNPQWTIMALSSIASEYVRKEI
ncbi:MAG: GMC family oxidoreductase [Saprospiraceae bacterium]|nr:GMC family oxidoreductase [Saprospiraceae bacterium]